MKIEQEFRLKVFGILPKEQRTGAFLGVLSSGHWPSDLGSLSGHYCESVMVFVPDTSRGFVAR